MKLLPFDLKKALAGHPVCTRLGNPAIELICFKDDSIEFPLFANIQVNSLLKKINQYYKNGRNHHKNDTDLDLFLLSQTKTMYLVIYKQPNSEKVCPIAVYDSREEAEKEGPKRAYPYLYQIIEIEVEI